MFLNCWHNSDLLAIVYPLSILFYALIINPRPKSDYWKGILAYASCVTFLKLLAQQNALALLTPGATFEEFVDVYKLGFKVFDKNTGSEGVFGYILWDVLVIICVIVHQHFLVIMGLWEKRELDIETYKEAKRRLTKYLNSPMRSSNLPTSVFRQGLSFELYEKATPLALLNQPR